MKKTFIILLSIFVTFMISACGDNRESSSDRINETLKINTTVYPLQFFTEQIAGDSVEVNSILPPGSDPHTYEPTTKEMVKMAESDAFIYSSAVLEGYAEKIAESIDPEGVRILEASKGIVMENSMHNHGEHDESGHSHESEEASHEGHDHGEKDPHIWLDPLRSIELAENIKQVLVELKPDQEEQFNENFNQLKVKLQNLDQKFHEQIENQPKDEIIVSHAAYGYWEQSYGIKQIAVSGLSPTEEPSQKELESIIETAEEHGLNYVLFEQNVTSKVSKVVQKEIGAESLRVHNISVLTEGNIQNNEDYFSLMEQNLEVLNKALSE